MFLPYVVSHRLNLTIKITDESQFFFLTVHLIMGSKQTQFCVIIIIRNNVFSWALELQYLKKAWFELFLLLWGLLWSVCVH